MEEVRTLVREEGREARNLLAFHICFDDPKHLRHPGKLYCKPPFSPRSVESRRPLKRTSESQDGLVKTHGRSASTGRDKRSELRSRYWALLFGNLQRAVDDIYSTVETHESLIECQEAILILEGYVHDFRSLAEWFRLESEYENTPAPQRPTSLAWEVRKTTLPSPSHSERVSPSPPITSPQQHASNETNSIKSVTEKIIEESLDDKKSDVAGSIHNLSENIVKLEKELISNETVDDAKIIEHKSEKNKIKTLVIESVLSPSEDQKTYVSFIKKSSVNRAEACTDTEGLGSPKKVVLRKPGVVKIDSACQTDDLSDKEIDNLINKQIDTVSQSEKIETRVESSTSKSDTTTPSKTVRTEISTGKNSVSTATSVPVKSESSVGKLNAATNSIANKSVKSETSIGRPTASLVPTRSVRSATGVTIRPNYSAALSRTYKPPATKPNVITSGPRHSFPIGNRSTTVSSSGKNIQKPINNTTLRTNLSKPVTTNARLLRSRTSGEIKPSVGIATTRTSGLVKQKTTIGIKNTVTASRISRPIPQHKNNATSVRRTYSSSILTKKESTVKNDPKRTSSASIEKLQEKFSKESDVESIASSAETIVNSSETIKQDTKKNSTGWLTVKGRSRFKNNVRLNDKHQFQWGNRFHEVSGTTSLPALALLNETDSEDDHGSPPNKDYGSHNKASTKSEFTKQTAKSEFNPQSYLKRTNTVLTKSPAKKLTTTMRNNNENNKNTEKSSNLLKRNEFKKLEIKNEARFNGIEAECGDIEGDKSDKAETAESQDEEEHRRKSQQLCEEEAKLTQEIAELQRSTTDIDTETDGTETDGEGGDEEECNGDADIEDKDISLETRYEPVLTGLTWGERMDTLAALEDLEARHPGRAVRLHQKLSNPERRRSLTETLRRYQVKHAKAQQRRLALQQEKAERLQALLARVEDVRTARSHLIEEKRIRMENRLMRAEQNRTQHLKGIVRKAHDEDEKLREIAFIKQLEEQNKRHDFMTLWKTQQYRLEDLQKQQKKKIEEQAARGAAVEERRRASERERQERFERSQEEKRLKAFERLDKQQRERQEQAREKAKDREERIAALNAQQDANKLELKKRINQKQEESARRHEENIEQIRQKALELSILRSHNEEPHTPALIPYEAQKLCTICNVYITSEVYLLSHLRGRAHQEAVHQATGPIVGDQLKRYELDHIIDAPANDEHPKVIAARERLKTLRKRCKKIRQRMMQKGAQYDSAYKAPCVNEIVKKALSRSSQKVNNIIGQGWSTSSCTQLDRTLGELNRSLAKSRNPDDFVAVQAVGWFNTLSKLLGLGLDPATTPPVKSLISACNLWQLVCDSNFYGARNCYHVVLSNKIIVVLDLLNKRLQDVVTEDRLPSEPLATVAMQLLTTVLNRAPDDTPPARLQELVSYAVCVGVVEQLAQCCVSVTGPVHHDTAACNFLQAALGLLASLARRCSSAPADLADPAHLTAALHATELVGAVSMLYGTLLPTGASPRCEGKPPSALPAPCLALATAVCRLLEQVAELDLKRFQDALGAEGVSLQFRHIASHLLWSCATPPQDPPNAVQAAQDLLHEVIAVVGYFAIGNQDNQLLLVSGYAPSVLQQLCTLPFQYFSVPDLSAVLYPTLLACCYGNQHTTAILEQELSYQLLEEFHGSEAGRVHPLVKLLPEVVTNSVATSDIVQPNSNAVKSAAKQKRAEATSNHVDEETNATTNSEQTTLNGVRAVAVAT